MILVDARHKPTDDDMTMLEFARYYEIPVAVVATKCDKVPPTKRAHHFANIRKTLKLNADEPCFLSQLLKSREWRKSGAISYRCSLPDRSTESSLTRGGSFLTA